jgi:GGDEF domain-containing protein
LTAAIGYAVFDPDTDTDTQSVFERADREMYRDKKEKPRLQPKPETEPKSK